LSYQAAQSSKVLCSSFHNFSWQSRSLSGAFCFIAILQKIIIKKEMKNNKYKNREKKEKPNHKRFKSVDLWQIHFGHTSVAAVIDIYSQKFSIPTWEAKRLDFSYCLEKLRKLEDSEYESKHNHNL